MSPFLDPNQIAGALLLGGLFVLVGLFLSWLVRRLLREALRYDRSERIDQITLSTPISFRRSTALERPC